MKRQTSLISDEFYELSAKQNKNYNKADASHGKKNLKFIKQL